MCHPQVVAPPLSQQAVAIPMQAVALPLQAVALPLQAVALLLVVVVLPLPPDKDVRLRPHHPAERDSEGKNPGWESSRCDARNVL